MHFIMYGCVYNLLSTTCMGTLGPDKDNAVSPEPSETGGQGTWGPGDQGARGSWGKEAVGTREPKGVGGEALFFVEVKKLVQQWYFSNCYVPLSSANTVVSVDID